jgi:dynein light intermediate chain
MSTIPNNNSNILTGYNNISQGTLAQPPVFKSKSEKLAYLKKEVAENSRLNPQREQNITLISSLVKYDTPYLISSTSKNRKTLEDLKESEEQSNTYLRNIINKDDDESLANFKYSVKDALNRLLPPKKITDKDQEWVQYVTCTPVAKSDVVNLQENLERKLQTEQARETGICPIREKLYTECFDELIRQITLNCLERGILLTRIKKELNMTVNSYQSLYESSIAYGIRTLLLAEEEKKKLSDEIGNIEKDCESLESEINEIDAKLRQHKEEDDAERKQLLLEHQQIIEENRAKGKAIKEKLRDKLTFIGK